MLQEFDESTENFVSAVITALEKHKKVEEIKDLRRYVLQRNVEANIEKYASWRVDQVRAQRRMIRELEQLRVASKQTQTETSKEPPLPITNQASCCAIL